MTDMISGLPLCGAFHLGFLARIRADPTKPESWSIHPEIFMHLKSAKLICSFVGGSKKQNYRGSGNTCNSPEYRRLSRLLVQSGRKTYSTDLNSERGWSLATPKSGEETDLLDLDLLDQDSSCGEKVPSRETELHHPDKPCGSSQGGAIVWQPGLCMKNRRTAVQYS
jgi:hypothetical protein